MNPQSCETSGSFSPRGLMLAGLSLHFAALVGLWQLAGFKLILLVAYYPVFTALSLLTIGALAVWGTRLAWRRNSWRAGLIYFASSILALGWIPALFATWHYRN